MPKGKVSFVRPIQARESFGLGQGKNAILLGVFKLYFCYFGSFEIKSSWVLCDRGLYSL